MVKNIFGATTIKEFEQLFCNTPKKNMNQSEVSVYMRCTLPMQDPYEWRRLPHCTLSMVVDSMIL